MHARLDIRAKGQQRWLRALIGIVAMGGAAKLVIAVGGRAHEGAPPVIIKGRIIVGLDDEGELAAQAFLRHDLLGGIHAGEAIQAVVAHLLEDRVGLIIISLVFGMLQINLSGQTRGLGNGHIVRHLAVRAHGDQAALGQQGVDGDHAGDVDLAMVADDEDIGIILDARVLDGLEQLAQPQIHLMQGMGDLGGEDAGLMAIGVDVGGMDHQQSGLELADHRAGTGVYKQVALRMLAVHAVHQVHVGLDDLFNHLRRGAGSGEALQRGFLGGLRPILVYQIIDIGVLARNRPENGGGGHAGLLGRVKDIAHLDGGIEKLPVGGQFAQDGLLVVDDAVLAAVRAGAHAGVVGIGDGGIHRAHAIDERALIPDAAKAGQLTQGLQILVNHGVFRNDDQMLCLAHMQDLLFLWLIAPVDSVHSETTDNPPAPHTRPSCWDTGLYTRPGAFDRLPPRRDRAYIQG